MAQRRYSMSALAFLTIAIGCADERPLPDNPATTPGGDLQYAYAVGLDEQCRCDTEGDLVGCPEFRFDDHLDDIVCADQLWGSHEAALAELASCYEALMLAYAECLRSRGCSALDECIAEYNDGESNCPGTFYDLGSFNDEVFDCAMP